MKEQLYLTFLVNQHRYGISSAHLEEMLPLSELISLQTNAPDVIGVLNLRGEIVPILDLNLSLGYEHSSYRTADSIIILRQSQLRVGLIVNSINELEKLTTINVDASDSRLLSQRREAYRKQMIAGKILSAKAANWTAEENICWLIDSPEEWLQPSEVQQLISAASALETKPKKLESLSDSLSDDLSKAPGTSFYPNTTPEERNIFRQRALSLQQPLAHTHQDSFSILTIIALDDVYFGVELSAVKEFANIQAITPIPCCPPHIVGNTNLRGDILTLIDIRDRLTASPPSSSVSAPPSAPKKLSAPQLKASKVMVIEIDQYVVGVVIKDIVEAMFSLDQQEMIASSNRPSSIDKRYFKGGFLYGDTSVNILDFSKILRTGNISIDETI